MKKSSFICLTVALLLPSLVEADVISTFDASLEGWTVASGLPDLSWSPTGGNPDGFALWNEPGDAGAQSLRAPSSFIGDWLSQYNGGTLTYDHKIIAAGGIQSFSPYRVDISGPGGAAFWEGTTPNGLTDWVPISVPISESSWTVSSGTWTSLLANISTLDIRIELVGNNVFQSEFAGIDNVRLVPEPISVPEPNCCSLLVVLGLSQFCRRHRTNR